MLTFLPALRPVTRAREKRSSAHGFFPGRLHLVENEQAKPCADRGLALVNQPLSRLRRFPFDMGAMNLEKGPIEIHESAGPRIEGTDASLQLLSGQCEIKLTFFLLEHGRIGHAFFRLR